MTDKPTLSRPMATTLAVAGAILVLLLLTLGSCGRDRTPAPTATATPDFWQMMEEKYGGAPMGESRAVYYSAPATPFPDMLYWVYTNINDIDPIPRPTTDPLYDPDTVHNYPIGVVCLTGNMDDEWPTCPDGDCTSGIQWSNSAGYDECFYDTAGDTVTLSSGEVISVPIILDIPPDFLMRVPAGTTPGPDGSYDRPYGDIELPGWMAADTYYKRFAVTPSGNYYWGIEYTALATVVAEMAVAIAEHYTATPEAWDRIAGIRIRTGYEGESAPVMPDTSRTYDSIDQVIGAHEAQVASGTEYWAWIDNVTAAVAAAFPGKSILPNVSLRSQLGTASTYTLRKHVIETAEAAGASSGVTVHLWASERTQADGQPGMTYEDYKDFTTLRTADEAGLPALGEFGNSAGISPPSSSAGDYWREWYWSIVSAFGAQADFIAFNSTWEPYISSWGAWIYDCAHNPKCAAVFMRDTEYLTYTWNHPNWGESGYKGDFSRNLSITNATAYPAGCSVAEATRAAATTTPASGAYQPYPCDWTPVPTPAVSILTTPVAGPTGEANMLNRLANRQARWINDGANMEIAIDATWDYAASTYEDSTIRIIYLDSNAADFDVMWPNSDSTNDSLTINRANSGIWKSQDIPATIYASGAITISNDSLGAADLWVHMAAVTLGTDPSEPTSTPTSTATSTSTSTSTSTPTSTSTSTPTATPTVTDTPEPTSSPTFTPTPTGSITPTPTSTSTVTLTPTSTLTRTPTSTRTSTPTPTSTNTATTFPLPTSTPTSTPTQSPMPAFTPTNTSTPAWTPISCPTIAVTVDGGLSEWAAVTPVALSYSSAGYVEAAATVTATPAAANASGNFYCGWSGSTLLFAGVISDATLLPPEGVYRNGDAALVSVDGRGDGFTRLRADDHDFYIPAPASGAIGSALVRDYDAYPIGVTAVISATATGWQFEMSVPNTIHQGGTFTTDSLIGLQYGLYDRDGGSNATYQIVGYRRRGDMD